MSRYIKKLSKTVGLSPGTLIHIGDNRTEDVSINIIDYTESEFQEKIAKGIEECFPFKDTSSVTWININGIHNIDIIEKIGQHFELHPLILEDILNTSQRPKYEDFENHIFIVLKMFYLSKDNQQIITEQVSFICGENFVISFQEKIGDVFDSVRDRIRNAKGKIRKMKSDYLTYALLDAIVDSYYSILEKMGEKIENMEDALITHPTPQKLQIIHDIKRDTILLRKSVWPLRELISTLERGESKLIKKSTYIYLRDVYDHTIQIIDTIETFRDMVSGMLDVYLSSISNRMNEVMKVLTIIATIFIPITFIAGVYGMNFNNEISIWNMPELNWKYGYISVWGVMLISVFIMLIYFKKKKWI